MMSTQGASVESIRAAIKELAARRDLDESEAYAVADAIMQGLVTPAQIAALLVALRMKGETASEITGFARAMRRHARRVCVDSESLVDTCGTGGDASGTFNISTTCAFVAAGAGVRIAKHGNRSVTSRCGSAELLEALGVSDKGEPEAAQRSIEETGIAFLFAPLYHGATRHAVGPRREIAIRSIFNIVGPLTNPAATKRQLMGVFDPTLTETLARVLQRLGSTHCMVVHGEDGLDEITLGGRTRISELRNDTIRTFDLDPNDLGFERRSLDEVRGGDPEENAAITLEVLKGRSGAPREIVLLNSGAAIYVAGVAESIQAGVEAARQSIDTGQALERLETLRRRAL
jgi:anthranilate phosphoribosyltransferase